MANRIKILEAPKATLGEAGVEQYIPIAEARDTGTVTAKNTTIADMANYFSELGETFDPVVVDFRFDARDSFSYPLGEDIPVDGSGDSIVVQFREENKTVYAGEDDALITNGPLFTPKETGVYIILCQFGGLYDYTGQIAGWRWRFEWFFGGAPFSRGGEGSYIRPITNAVNAERLLFDFELLGVLTEGFQYELLVTIRNIGTSSNAARGEEAIVFTQGTGLTNCGISFIRVA